MYAFCFSLSCGQLNVQRCNVGLHSDVSRDAICTAGSVEFEILIGIFFLLLYVDAVINKTPSGKK